MPCSLQHSRGSAVAHHAGRADAGVARTFLWWAWSGGVPELQAKLMPAAAPVPIMTRAKALAARLWRCGRAEAAAGDAAEEKPVAVAKPAVVPCLDGLTATMLDEAMLRGEPMLAPYWAARHSLRGACSAFVTSRTAQLEVLHRFVLLLWHFGSCSSSPLTSN